MKNLSHAVPYMFVFSILFSVILFAQGTVAPSEERAKEALNSSPRHGEFVDVSYPGHEFPINTWVVYPESSGKAPAVIVIHEIYGLTDWIRSVADQLAADGFIALAPDFISGLGPDLGGTESVESRDDIVRLIRGLSVGEVTSRLHAVREHALSIPAANGKISTMGFCWGGAMSFHYATELPDLDAAVVYYGTSAQTDRLQHISAPVLGLYGEDDARVNVTIEPAADEMKRLGKHFEYHIYPGAGHGFLRNQSGRDGANLNASSQAWRETVEFLGRNLK